MSDSSEAVYARIVLRKGHEFSESEIRVSLLQLGLVPLAVEFWRPGDWAVVAFASEQERQSLKEAVRERNELVPFAEKVSWFEGAELGDFLTRIQAKKTRKIKKAREAKRAEKKVAPAKPKAPQRKTRAANSN